MGTEDPTNWEWLGGGAWTLVQVVASMASIGGGLYALYQARTAKEINDEISEKMDLVRIAEAKSALESALRDARRLSKNTASQRRGRDFKSGLSDIQTQLDKAHTLIAAMTLDDDELEPLVDAAQASLSTLRTLDPTPDSIEELGMHIRDVLSGVGRISKHSKQ